MSHVLCNMLIFLYIAKITEESTSESQNDESDQSSGRRSDASDESSSIASEKGHSLPYHHSFPLLTIFFILSRTDVRSW